MQIKQSNIVVGFSVYLIAAMLLIFAAAPLQSQYGLWGLILTEIIILACALIPALLLGNNLKSLFVCKVPTIRQVLGVLLLWGGIMPIVYFVTMLTMNLFPEGMGEVSQSLSTFFTSAPLPLALFAVAIMPAFCEEALFRGFLQSMFGKIRRQWVVVILTAVLFGIFHLDIYRFIPTTILGIALCYIMAETGNFLLPVLLHFMNNTWSTVLTFLSNSSAQSAPVQVNRIPLFMLAVILVVCAISPWLIMAGRDRLKSADQVIDPKVYRRQKGAVIGISVLCLFSGLGLAAVSSSDLQQKETVLDMRFTANPTKEMQSDTHQILIEQSGYFNLEYSVKKATDKQGSTSILLQDAENKILFEITGGDLFGNTPLTLSAGTYTLTFMYQYDWQGNPKVDLHFAITRLSSK